MGARSTLSSLVSSSPPSLEVYVYDTRAVDSEAVDPLNAVLFHYPKELTEEKVLVTAGQLAAVAQFFRLDFLMSRDTEEE